MNETTAVFVGIIIGIFLVLFCCAILYAYTKISKRIDSFKETERKAYSKARERAEEKYKELSDRVSALEKSDREKKISDEKFRCEVEELKTPRIQTRVRHHSNVIPFERNTE
ncbi:hypothetical protein [Ruminococcus sp.]|uniref:hypothetical protein n=1 Tax=Ruminococcus sp. TaxID=41978 RepID=UPI00388F631B